MSAAAWIVLVLALVSLGVFIGQRAIRPKTDCVDPTYVGDGSLGRPYRTLDEAANDTSGRRNIFIDARAGTRKGCE